MAGTVTTEGKNDTLSKYFKGSAYTATWFVGLVDNTGFTAFAATDTAAKITTTANPPTTNGWQESTIYSQANRVTLTLGTPSGGSVDNSASVATFSINNSGTLKGGFVVSNSTKAGTSGILYGDGAFSATRAVVSGDSVQVTVTLTQV